MRKALRWSIIILVVVIIGLLIWHILSPYKKVDLLYAIPSKPVFVIETDNPYQAWEKLTSSEVWSNLKKHPFFNQIGKGIDMLDSVVHSNEKLAKYIGSRSLIISMHIIQKGSYDFVYAVDLRRASKLLAAKGYVDKLLALKFKFSSIKYNNVKIYNISDTARRQVLHLYFMNNLMVASYNLKLIESSIDQFGKSTLADDPNFASIREKTKGNGLFRFYVNYVQLDDYTNGLLVTPDPNIRQLSKSLLYTGLWFDIDNDNLIECEGFTNVNDTLISSFRAMAKSGKGKTDLADVLPLQTASSVSIGFDRFTDYFDNFMDNLKETPKSFDDYQANIKQAESFLNIDVRKNIMSWIDDEVAMVNLPPLGLGRNNEFAIFMKTRNMKDAKENLDYVMKQVKKRSPAKFESVQYNDYDINYLSIKGFFRMLLGKYFQKLEKPYFCYIGDYVVFSNHPQTLKVIIDGFTRQTLLANVTEYKSFTRNFSRQSNVLMLVNTSQFLHSLQGLVNGSTWSELQKNKEYIVSFPYIGFQLEEDGELFKTKLYVKFNGTEEEEVQPLDSIISDDVDSSGYNVDKTDITNLLNNVDKYIPDNINSSSYHENYDNGQLKVEFELKDGFRHGDYKEYYENGIIKIKGSFRKDQKDGTWKFYSEEGKLIQKVKFEDGKRE